MIRAVIDTNVIISSLFWKGAPFEVVQKGLGGAFIITSSAILDETFAKLTEKFGLPISETSLLMREIVCSADVIEPAIRVWAVVKDPSNNKIFECALEGDADLIVTGDKHLLDFGVFRSIKICTPAKFLTELI